MDDTKKINILGTTNRYMIKKVSQPKEAPKKRAVSSYDLTSGEAPLS